MHDLVQAVKDLALELGRTPRKSELLARLKGSGHALSQHVGGYSTVLMAAGLEPYHRPKKIDNSIFERPIEKHLELHVPPAHEPPEPFPSCAIISDIHWPFSLERVIESFYEYLSECKPEFVIINGDAWDMYSHSKFPRSHNLFTPREEERLSREHNEAFWREVKKWSPDSRCFQLLGNHDIRPMKRVLEAYPEAEDWIAERLQRMFTFEGVKTIYDSREELFLNKQTLVFHGYRTQLGAHRDYTLYNCFNGHTHVGGVVWRQIRGFPIFEANSGLAGDPTAKGLTYTPQKIVAWTPGFVACDHLGPRFIPA